MFSEKFLLKLSFVCTLIGIIGLVAISIYMEPLHVNTEQIDDSYLGKKVVVNGTVFNYANKGTIFFDLNGIKSVIFEKNAVNTNIKNGDFVTVKGTVQLYKNDIEIVVDKIL